MEIIRKNKGITLIALVITIIILLILAGISIATLTGENGLLTKAGDTKEETRGASVQEARDLWKINQEADKHTENKTAQELGDLLKDLESQKLITPEERVTIEETGQVTIGSRTIVFKEIDISDYVKIGNYVDYNPTVSDKSGTPVEANKLTYTSPTGSATEHGNGYVSIEEGGGQKFTATASTKWKVLDIGDGTVTLIAAEPIKKDEISQNSGYFNLQGARGYLYAERELNEICKIFGYGYGADTSQVTKYSYGGPVDGELTGKITGSGARSITIEDINKKAGIYEDKTDGQMKYRDGTVINSSYGSTTNPPSTVYYPTVNGDSATGKSTSPGVQKLKYTYYKYDKLKIENTDVQGVLFNGGYWLASRCILSGSDRANFLVHHVNNWSGGGVSAFYLCDGYSSLLNEQTPCSSWVRPVVTLKSDIIDISTNYTTEGKWKLK